MRTFRDPSDTDRCQTGAEQFSIEVTAHADGVLFEFSNGGPKDAFISEIYFRDATSVLGDATLNVGNVGSVAFNDDDVKPKNLPGGNGIGFTATYAAQPDSPGTNKDGIDPGESLGIVIDSSFADIEAALLGGDLLVALRGQGLWPDGESESFFVSGPPIPEPGSALLFALGVLGLRGALRHRP